MNGKTDLKMWLHVIVIVFQTIIVIFGYEVRHIVRQNEREISELNRRIARIELAVWKEMEQKVDRDAPTSPDLDRRLERLERSEHTHGPGH
jgi:hypothetical protein